MVTVKVSFGVLSLSVPASCQSVDDMASLVGAEIMLIFLRNKLSYDHQFAADK